MTDELNENLIETPEATPTPETKNPSVVAAGWLFAALCSGFLVILVLITLYIYPVSRLTGVPSIAALNGSEVYKSLGCGECHTRHVRPGDINMDMPASIGTMSSILVDPGTSRIGPDLQNISGKFNDEELLDRLLNPASMNPGTLMPSYRKLPPESMSVLIQYLQDPVIPEFGFEEVRQANEIESDVPINILAEMSPYMETSSYKLILPIQANDTTATIGSGIFNSRCASCHGIDGTGSDTGAVTSLTDEYIRSLSDVALYWRIADGIPGSGMPAWRGTISTDGIWYLISYIRSLETAENYDEIMIDPEAPLWFDLSISEDEMNWLFPDWELYDETDIFSEENTDEIRIENESASEEEGVSTGENGTSDGAEESSYDPGSVEESR